MEAKSNPVVQCRICSGAGVIVEPLCSHSGNCPCPQRETACSTCDGLGEYPLCAECEEAPADERFGPFICEACAQSCPCCERGTLQHGVVCRWCLDQELADLHVHEAAHGPEVAP